MRGAKTVLIRAAERGLGLAFVKHYKQQGWNVIATARNLRDAESLQALAPWKLLELTLLDERSIDRAVRDLETIPIDLIVHSAGMAMAGSLETTTKQDMLRQYELNAVGPLLFTRALLPNLKQAVHNYQAIIKKEEFSERGAAAVVAHVASGLGSIEQNTSGDHYGYRASRTAMNMLNKSLALDLYLENIAFVMLHPGFVQSLYEQSRISPEDSVAGMAKLLDEMTMEDSSQFVDVKGSIVPW